MLEALSAGPDGVLQSFVFLGSQRHVTPIAPDRHPRHDLENGLIREGRDNACRARHAANQAVAFQMNGERINHGALFIHRGRCLIPDCQTRIQILPPQSGVEPRR